MWPCPTAVTATAAGSAARRRVPAAVEGHCRRLRRWGQQRARCSGLAWVQAGGVGSRTSSTNKGALAALPRRPPNVWPADPYTRAVQAVRPQPRVPCPRALKGGVKHRTAIRPVPLTAAANTARPTAAITTVAAVVWAPAARAPRRELVSRTHRRLFRASNGWSTPSDG